MPSNRVARICAIIASALALACLFQGTASAHTARHVLQVELRPERKELHVHDNIRIDGMETGNLVVLIAERAKIGAVSIDGVDTPYHFLSGRLSVPVRSPADSKEVSLGISYEAEFRDPLPLESAVADNPGYGVTGAITEKGSFFLPDSGWYPQLPQLRSTFRIRVTAPSGIRAVTAGRLIGHADSGTDTVSTWEVGDIGQGLSLSAARYMVHSTMAGGIPVFTYFFQETDSLSETYLNAAASCLAFYESLHGPYPFPKFAVVENFFPTGYGFPSYTLLGTTVLRLPFISRTSLRHEIAHSWWGNGVLVDYRSGNWCEGLTSYVADYLSEEIASVEAGKLYRRQILLDYATLVRPADDFPLARFTGRTSPSTRAVGYGKAAFIFHMIRRRIGDEPFWQALREIFRERLFSKTSWEDFRRAFVRTGKWDDGESRRFFEQWIMRSGAPSLKLRNVRAQKTAPAWKTDGSLRQNAPCYELYPTLKTRTASGELETPIRSDHRNVSFSLETEQAPEELVVDPDVHLFRRLSPVEIPVTVNSVKSSRNLTAVLAQGAPPRSTDAFRVLLQGLDHPETAILREREVDADMIRGRDVLFFGLPRSTRLRALLAEKPSGVELAEGQWAIPGVTAEADCVFLTIGGAGRTGRSAAIFMPIPGAGEQDIVSAARKITHYGKYSYLAFSRGTNQAKGTWNTSRSPLRHIFRRER